MTARARVREDLAYDGVAVQISPRRGFYLQLAPADQFDGAEVEATQGAEPPLSSQLRLRHDEARALYAELARFYGGVHDDTSVKALRGDYDHEKRRVDKLIDHLISPTSTGPAPAAAGPVASEAGQVTSTARTTTPSSSPPTFGFAPRRPRLREDTTP